jgi:hypothetical protein
MIRFRTKNSIYVLDTEANILTGETGVHAGTTRELKPGYPLPKVDEAFWANKVKGGLYVSTTVLEIL